MGITETIATMAVSIIDSTGYITIFGAMVLESMVFPLPSEAVMPFAGFLIESGRFSFQGVIIFSVLGSITGSLISYYIGKFGGKPFIHKFGKYFLLDQEELDMTETFFKKHGQITVLICRFIPVVRHLISIPAGIGKMNLFNFIVFTLVGAAIWNSILTVAGYFMKQQWTAIMKYSEIIDVVCVIFILVLIGMFILRQLKKRASKKG